jgi:hypothetical protein
MTFGSILPSEISKDSIIFFAQHSGTARRVLSVEGIGPVRIYLRVIEESEK